MEGGKAYRIRRAKESPRGPLLSPCVAVVFVSFGPPSQWERGTIGSPTTATESRGSRAILACSPESFWRPYFVNEPQTRGAAARPNTGRGRCPLSENLFRYMKKNKQQKNAVICTLSGDQAREGKTVSEIFNFAPCRAIKPERVKKDYSFTGCTSFNKCGKMMSESLKYFAGCKVSRSAVNASHNSGRCTHLRESRSQLSTR